MPTAPAIARDWKCYRGFPMQAVQTNIISPGKQLGIENAIAAKKIWGCPLPSNEPAIAGNRKSYRGFGAGDIQPQASGRAHRDPTTVTAAAQIACTSRQQKATTPRPPGEPGTVPSFAGTAAKLSLGASFQRPLTKPWSAEMGLSRCRGPPQPPPSPAHLLPLIPHDLPFTFARGR